MFNTKHRSRLSDFRSYGGIVRDCEFFGVAKVPSRVDARLVPVTDAANVKELMAQLPGVAAVICTKDLVDSIPGHLGCLQSDAPRIAAHQIHCELTSRPDYYWTSFKTRIGAGADIHPSAWIAPTNVEIGDRVTIGPGTVIHERSIIAAGSHIGSKNVIGTDAFEPARVERRNQLLAQAGGVRIGEDSILLSGIMIAHSAFPTFTELGARCAIDNLVHVAHDCMIGDDSHLTAGAILSGRVTMGEGSFVGPNATISNGLFIGAKGKVTIGSMVARDVEAGQRVSGYFATEHRTFLKRLLKQ
jgi:UDP-3-O-[3-hydroxymyristoyl] glucosamine N-acyltransferase